MPGDPTPKDRFTSLDTLALVRELRAVRGARVDKAFDRPQGGWALTLRVAREGRHELLLVPGQFGALLREAGPHAEELSPFAKELRRVLEGSVLDEVPDAGGERLLEFVLRRAADPSPTRVALEMFGSGNLIVAHGEKIVAAAQSRKWAHRTVAVGAPYARPPSRADPFTLGPAEIEGELLRSRTDLASTLAARLALGGPLAEEVVSRGGWDGAQPAAARAERVGSELHRVLQGLFLDVGEPPLGYVYRRQGVPVDATPYRSQRWRGVADVEEVPRPTFSVASVEYFSTLATATATPEERARSQRLKELERQVDRQRAAVTELEQRVEELQADAAAIFDHYADAEKALRSAGGRADSGTTIEARLGDRTVTLFSKESPRATAQRFFEDSKRAQAKLHGARDAVAAAAQELETHRLVAPGGGRSAPASPEAPSRRRPRWFERYRWFLSSEGAIVVGGRDAATNDLLVRRHLKDGDYYIHADIHGAASVVVKHPAPGEPPVTEVTLREAAQWAAAFSKAWRAGLASASAFWVRPDQVSKSGGSGEFVAKGAWVIHGTKNVERDLPLELGIGTVDYAGEELWTVAPPSAFGRRGTLRAVLTPGPESRRAEVEVELTRELGLARSRLQALLPAGGISARRA